MKKEPANAGAVGTKKTGAAAVHHTKSAAKRVSADVEEKKRKAGSIMTSAPANMPLAVVVVEVQTSQNVKGKAGVESKVKKKSVTLKTTSVPVKKVRSPSPKKNTTEESKTKQAKPKKVIATPIKTPKLKATKKADAKKPTKAAPKAKSDKLTKKQKLAQEKQQQKKQATTSESVPTSPITVVISEQDGNDKSAPVSISCKKTPSKPAAKKQTKSVQAKKSGVAAGKIGKRKPIIKKTVAKEIGKAFKSDSEKKKDTDKSSDTPASDQAPSDKNEANQPPKKVTSNKKTKNDDASPTLDLDLSSTAVIDKSKTIAKTVKSKGADKPKAVKAKKNTKTTDEQSEENQHESAAKDENQSTDTAPKTESKKKEKPVKVEKSKVASEKKTTSDTKECSKKEETKTKKPKADSKSSSNQQQKSKAKGKIDTVGKTKKTAKVEEETEKECGEKKSDEASDHNDSSTSDELPLELIKRQQKAKPQPQPQNEKTEPVTKPSIAVKEEKIAYEECVKIKEEIDDLYDFKSSDGDCKVKDELIKEESVKEVSEKKNIKSSNKEESSEKDVKKKAVKKPVVKPGAVKAGVKGKAAGNTKAAKAKAAKVPRKASSDDDDKSDDNQESSDDAKKNKKLKKTSSKSGSDSEKRARRMKLFGFWSGPKKHRVASLNALAKVHCLYENESRVMEKAMIEMSETSSPAPKPSAAKASEAKASKEKVETKTEKAEDSLATTRTLRSNPGLRSVGRHYDILNASSTTSSFTSSDDSSDGAEDTKKLQLQPSVKQKQQNRAKKQQEKQKAAPKAKVKPKTILVSTDGTSEEEDQKDKKTAASSSSSSSDNPDSSRKVKKRRKRNELMMDLKDMVVRKRMASLNASAILAASYSMEKRSSSSSNTRKEDSEEDSSRSSRPERKRKSKTSSDSSPDMEVEDSSCEEDVLIRGGGSKQKVAVIVNQDTDLTITGVYVNSTTRSTHHEGFCSIAGMQYRISSTSHTQTEATAVATETVLHTDHPASVREPAVVAQPGKSYTPLGALSSMQPPGHGHRGGPSPLAGPRRPPPPHHAPCSSTSAFSAPPAPPPQDPAYVHGYYQPAGPLISHHHHQHHHSTTTSSSSSSQSVAASKLPPATSPPPSTSASAPPASETDQADSAVASCSSSQRTHPPPEDQRIIPPEVAYRYPPYHGYQYYPSPPANIQYPPQPQSHYHQEICYSSPNPYPSPYFPSSSHKSAPYPPPTYHHRRYVPPQYYSHQELYSTPPPTQMIVPPAGGSSSSGSAPPPTSSSASSYPPPPDTGYPPPPPPPAPMVDGYHPPPPTYPYPAYSTGPPPACYSHSPPNRLAFIDGPTYQGCPCPMQSCPKNVYTGPLTGASKGSLKNHQSTTPLPPVALALPLEPPGAVGPPSPARGSAGMPPPPSPALATARNPNPPAQWNESPPPDTKSQSETGLLVISKVVTDSVLGIPDSETNCAAETLIALKESSILMPKVTDVKIEVDESMMTTTYTQQEIAAAVDLRTMATNCRKRRRLNGSIVEVRRLSTESVNLPENLQKTRPLTEVQERLVTDVVASQTNIKEVTPVITSITESKDDVENRLPTPPPPPRSASPTVPVLPRKQQQPTQPHHPLSTSTKRKTTDASCQLSTTTTSTTPVVSSSKCKKRKTDSIAVVKETKKKCKVTEPQPEVVKSESVEPEVKAGKRKNGGKVTERRKSTSAERATPTVKAEPVSAHASTDVTSQVCEEVQVSQPKKVCRGRKSLEKPAASLKGKNVPKNNATAKGSKKDISPSPTAAKKQQQTAASSGEISEEKVEFAEPLPVVCNPKKTHPVLKWSNGWSWEGTPYKAKVFLTSDDVPVIRKCYPSMKHKGGDIICPRDCVLLKSGKSKLDLPFVAKVAALWENPEDGEMMMSLLWYYRPEHTDQGRREEDNVDEIFASRHKDINSVACIEDKCFVLTFNEYCRYRKIVRRCEEGLTAAERVVPMLDGSAYPRLNRQPPGQVASDLVFFCRRVYDFRQRRMLKNPS